MTAVAESTSEPVRPGPCPACNAQGSSQRWVDDTDDAICDECGTSYWMTTVDPS